MIERTAPEVAKGAVFFDPDIDEPAVLRFLTGDVADGNGEIVRRTLAAVRVRPDGRIEPAPATSLFDVVPPTDEIRVPPENPLPAASEADTELIMWARQHLFERVFLDAKAERRACRRHPGRLPQAVLQLPARPGRLRHHRRGRRDRPRHPGRGRPPPQSRTRQGTAPAAPSAAPGGDATGPQRRARRRHRARQRAAAPFARPCPSSESRDAPGKGSLADEEIEQIAVRIARRYETGRGATVRSVEDEHVGFDLLSTRGPERRCIEVKGRAGVARVELTWSEFAKSQELGDDYWLYVVLDCAQPEPRLYRVRNPARSLAGAWEPSLDVRYRRRPRTRYRSFQRSTRVTDRRLIEEELPLKEVNAAVGPGEVAASRPYLHHAPVVGTPPARHEPGSSARHPAA